MRHCLLSPFQTNIKKNFIYKTSEIGFCTESILQAKHEMHNNALLTLKYSMRYKWQTNMKASSITGFEHYKKGVRTSCTFEWMGIKAWKTITCTGLDTYLHPTCMISKKVETKLTHERFLSLDWMWPSVSSNFFLLKNIWLTKVKS